VKTFDHLSDYHQFISTKRRYQKQVPAPYKVEALTLALGKIDAMIATLDLMLMKGGAA
jgi:hypothetical protein